MTTGHGDPSRARLLEDVDTRARSTTDVGTPVALCAVACAVESADTTAPAAASGIGEISVSGGSGTTRGVDDTDKKNSRPMWKSTRQEKDLWGPLPTPSEAWARLMAYWRPAPLRAETVLLLEAVGRVLAADVVSPRDSPPFDRAAMDGYAVRAGDLALPEQLRAALALVGEVPMGQAASVGLAPGQAIWVATGSMIPPGADAVVNVERTALTDGWVAVSGPVHPGDNIILRAEDLRAGDRLLHRGRRLRPGDVAALASLGYAQATVIRQPRVAVLVTGDELRLPGQLLQAGQIYSSNGYALAAQVREAGGVPLLRPPLPDTQEAVVSALERALHDAEIVLISGGSSVGRQDLTVPALASLTNSAILVHGVAARPARPTILAVVDDRLVIGIPGNPVAAMVAATMCAIPAVEQLLGLSDEETAVPRHGSTLSARLTVPLPSVAGRQDYIRVRVQRSVDGWTASPVPGGSASLSSMVVADGYVVIPPCRAGLASGETVTVIAF